MAADAATAPASTDPRRSLWIGGTLAATAGPIVVVAALAPAATAAPGSALAWVLFVGSSVHVASTGWFYTVAEVRRHMWRHPARYVVAPAALIVGTAGATAVLDAHLTTWLLLAFFAWQFVHFQKQNLGVVALVTRARGIRAPSRVERRAIEAAGLGGVLALIGHPTLLQVTGAPRTDLLFDLGATVLGAAVVVGLIAVARRAAADRPPAFVAVVVGSLLFFLPAVTLTSPYAAVAGLTIAHGLQYLLLVDMVAAGPSGERRPSTSLLILLNVALLLGLALNRMSHLHGAHGTGRWLFGAYLGLTAAHFVIDAGLWRLRDDFPREFLTRRLPYLLSE